MILHVWMHWFWITTSFKCFLLFATQLISTSCISHPSMTEAGLLENGTITHKDFNLYKLNDSSQLGHGENGTSFADDAADVTTSGEVETSSLLMSDAVTNVTEAAYYNGTTAELVQSVDADTDAEDTYNGETLDTHRYPLVKEVIRFSRLKGNEGTRKPEAQTTHSVRMVEEKLAVNTSDGGSVVEDTTEGVNITESTTTAGPMLVTPYENGTSDSATNASLANVYNVTNEDVVGEDEPSKMEVATITANASDPAANETEEDVVEDTFRNESLVIENKVEESVLHTTVEPFPVKNRVAAATSAQNFELPQSGMNAGSVTGITLGILVIFALFGAVSFVLYRRRYLNKPQVLHDKCSNLDSSGYIDDASLRENSEEMYSLDNDSFLNSLEAMTIQNYWTENVKHTKL